MKGARALYLAGVGVICAWVLVPLWLLAANALGGQALISAWPKPFVPAAFSLATLGEFLAIEGVFRAMLIGFEVAVLCTVFSVLLGLPAGELLGDVGQFQELIGLAAQLVGHHRRAGADGGDDRYPHALALHRLYQAAEVGIAAEQNHVIKLVGKLQHVHRDLNVHVSLDPAPSRGIGEFLRRLRHQGVAVIGQPIGQWFQRRIFFRLQHSRVIVGAQDIRFFPKVFQQVTVIDIEPKVPRSRV